jgi:hypothetical protein
MPNTYIFRSNQRLFDEYDADVLHGMLDNMFFWQPLEGSILVFQLNESRGERGIWLGCHSGVTDLRFNPMQSNNMTHWVKQTCNALGATYAIGFTADCFEWLFRQFVTGDGLRLRIISVNILSLKPWQDLVMVPGKDIPVNRKKETKRKVNDCWLCGKPIFNTDNRYFLCLDHRLERYNQLEHGVVADEYVTVGAHPLNQHYLKDKLSFGVEFEISDIASSCRDEVATIIEMHKWVNTSDCTVAGEFKSPVYIGYLPVYETKNIFDFFDYGIAKRYFSVRQGAGTHVHIATTDENVDWWQDGAIKRKLRNDRVAAKKVYQLIRGMEFVIDTADGDWVNRIFGRPFCSRYAKKAYQDASRPADNMTRLFDDRYHWVNLTQYNYNRYRKTIEFRLLMYRNKKQYIAGLKVSIFMFKAIIDVLYNGGNQFAWIERFEARCNRVFQDEVKPNPVIEGEIL